MRSTKMAQCRNHPEKNRYSGQLPVLFIDTENHFTLKMTQLKISQLTAHHENT